MLVYVAEAYNIPDQWHQHPFLPQDHHIHPAVPQSEPLKQNLSPVGKTELDDAN